MRYLTRWVLCLCGLLGCEGGGGDATLDGGGGDVTLDGGGGTPARNEDTSAGALLVAAHAVPHAAQSNAVAAATILVNAVFVASLQGGGGARVVTTGTVRQQGQSWVWSAGPDDALVVVLPDRELRFVVEDLQAADVSSPDAVLSGDHILRFTVTTAKFGELRVRSVKQAGQRDATLDGHLVLDDVDYGIESLRYQGTEYSEVDSTGSEYRNTYHLTGAMTGGDGRFDVDERWRFEIVTTTGSRGGSAQTAERVANSALTLGDDRYQWVEATTRKAFKDGKAGDPDYWAAQGEVRRNGQAFGRYRLDARVLDAEGHGWIVFQLVLPGETLELERNPAY